MIIYIFLFVVATTLKITSAGVVGCYYGSWAVYKQDHGKCEVNNIDPTLCTHLFYSFAGLNENQHIIESLDEWNDLPDNGGLGNYININNLRNQNPSLKVLLSIGGWNEGSEKYSNMVNNDQWRKSFVDSVEAFLLKYKFDGLDIDWEYPSQRGGKPSDRQAFVILLSELRERFDVHGWVLTGAFGVNTDLLQEAYDVQNIAKYIDYFNLMTYAYHGLWEQMTGPNSPLHGSPSIEETIDDWLNTGMPAEKLVLGLPFYGLTFILKDANDVRMGAPVENYSFGGPWSQTDGILGYNEICIELQNGGWTENYDSQSETPFATSDTKFIAYDNAESIQKKVAYAMNKGFAGAMTWSIDSDDLYNDCGSGSHYLLRVLNNAINNN